MELTNLHRRIAPHYIGFRTSSMIDEDIKLIKKLNVIFGKLEKSGKDSYFLEAVNIVKTLNNTLKIKDIQDIFLELINLNYQQIVLQIINNLDKIDIKAVRGMIDEPEED